VTAYLLGLIFCDPNSNLLMRSKFVNYTGPLRMGSTHYCLRFETEHSSWLRMHLTPADERTWTSACTSLLKTQYKLQLLGPHCLDVLGPRVRARSSKLWGLKRIGVGPWTLNAHGSWWVPRGRACAPGPSLAYLRALSRPQVLWGKALCVIWTCVEGNKKRTQIGIQFIICKGTL